MLIKMLIICKTYISYGGLLDKINVDKQKR